MTAALLRLLGVRVEDIPREEAARLLLQREVRFSWRPVVVELDRGLVEGVGLSEGEALD